MVQNIHVARRQVQVNNDLELYLRVADKFVKLANSFQSEVRVHCKGIIANGKSILSLLSLAAECGTMLALEAEGCDAEDAVAALANLISDQSHESEDQHREAGNSSPTKSLSREGSSTKSPVSQRSGRSWKSAPTWDSWRRRSTAGRGIERLRVPRGRWCRRGSRSGG
jgi:phosphocarrier protein